MPSSGAMRASSASVEKKAILRGKRVEYTKGPRAGWRRRADFVVNKGNLAVFKWWWMDANVRCISCERSRPVRSKREVQQMGENDPVLRHRPRL